MNHKILGDDFPATWRVYWHGLLLTGIVASGTVAICGFDVAVRAIPLFVIVAVGVRLVAARITVEASKSATAILRLEKSVRDVRPRRMGRVSPNVVRSVSLQIRDYQITIKVKSPARSDGKVVNVAESKP